MKPTRFSRRNFLRKVARVAFAAAAAPQIVPSSVLGMGGATSPNDRISVGFIGTGDHGVNWNLHPYLRHKAARVVAACDVDSKRLFRAQETINNHYKNEDCFTTRDFREILARKDIDAVMISTPDHWHTLISLMAVQAGKDVQCEKPTLTIMGTGFPPFRGGLLRYADSLGAEAILMQLTDLQRVHGARFAPAGLIMELSAADRRFYQAYP